MGSTRLHCKPLCRIALLLIGGVLSLFAAGCMSMRPSETDMPWAAPANWEGTIGLPASYMDRYGE